MKPFNKVVKEYISRALAKLPLLDESEVGFKAVEIPAYDMVCKLRYRTVGEENREVSHKCITAELWEWERAGCKNNDEWRAYLNRVLFREFSCGLKI